MERNRGYGRRSLISGFLRGSAGLAAAGALGSAFGGPRLAFADTAAGGVLKWGDNLPQTLDPHAVVDTRSAITRLNVYAGLAGFNIVRDQFDTGDPTTNNPKLPCYPYEQLIVIQDRMFTEDFQLYYPSDPLTATELFGPAQYPNPTVMAEFFGDHILVNGQAWPVLDVQPRLYRLRFLNGCDRGRLFDDGLDRRG